MVWVFRRKALFVRPAHCNLCDPNGAFLHRKQRSVKIFRSTFQLNFVAYLR